MTSTKLVIRLLDAKGMVGWTEHMGRVKGDGLIWSQAHVFVTALRDVEMPAEVSVHWCDLNVEVRVPFAVEYQIPAGLTAYLFAPDVPLIRVGKVPVGLPPVTVGAPVSIDVPVGTLGSRG